MIGKSAIKIEPLLLDERAAARALSISDRTLSKLRKKGKLTCVRIGRAVRYEVAELQRWISSQAASTA
jgi:excisionase family DNA binding protein